MYSIHSLMKCIFPIDVVKNIPNTSFSRDDYSFFIIFISVLFLNYL